MKSTSDVKNTQHICVRSVFTRATPFVLVGSKLLDFWTRIVSHTLDYEWNILRCRISLGTSLKRAERRLQKPTRFDGLPTKRKVSPKTDEIMGNSDAAMAVPAVPGGWKSAQRACLLRGNCLPSIIGSPEFNTRILSMKFNRIQRTRILQNAKYILCLQIKLDILRKSHGHRPSVLRKCKGWFPCIWYQAVKTAINLYSIHCANFNFNLSESVLRFGLTLVSVSIHRQPLEKIWFMLSTICNEQNQINYTNP